MSSRPAPALRVLVVDPETSTRRAAARALVDAGLSAVTAESVDVAISLIASGPVDAVLLGAELLGVSPRDACLRLRAAQRDVPIVVTATALALEQDPSLAARDDIGLLVKPPPVATLWVHAASRAMTAKEPAPDSHPAPAEDEGGDELVGLTRAVRDAMRIALASADSDAPMLLLGEPGTGRETLARAVHRRGRRRASPFVVFACDGARAEERERLLFGHDGSGGALAAAQKGTLFLGEIQALPADAQVRLARAMERHTEARVIAAAPPDLFARTKEATFRRDLYFQLAVVETLLPPLRRRREDVPVLAHVFLRAAARHLGRDVRRLGAETARVLAQRPWPGNLDELRATMERAVALASGETLYPSDLPPEKDDAPLIDERVEAAAGAPAHVELPYADAKARALDGFHRAYLTELLRRSEGNVSEAARRAGLDRANFRRVLRKIEARPRPRKR